VSLFYARRCAAILTVVLTGVPLLVQPHLASTYNGEVHSDSETVMHGYVVELEELTSHRSFAQTDVELDGSFRFRNVPYGDYVLKVETYSGDVLQQAYVTVDAKVSPPTLQLPKQKQSRPPSGGVSAARLLHPPEKKAYKALVAAQKLSESGRYVEAARELQRAIAISPDYANAHSNLAVQYMRLGRFEESLAESSRAMEIAKPNVVDLSNMACAQTALHRVGDAIQSARAALGLEPGNANAHYILGSLLAGDRRTLREGITHLVLAADRLPNAQLNLQRARAALAANPTL